MIHLKKSPIVVPFNLKTKALSTFLNPMTTPFTKLRKLPLSQSSRTTKSSRAKSLKRLVLVRISQVEAWASLTQGERVILLYLFPRE
jgi:hypothetical protein